MSRSQHVAATLLILLVSSVPCSSTVSQCLTVPPLNTSYTSLSLVGLFTPSLACDPLCGNVTTLASCSAGCLQCADGSVLGLYDVVSCGGLAGTSPGSLVNATTLRARLKYGFPEVNACASVAVLVAAPPALSPPPQPPSAWDGTVRLNGAALAVSWRMAASSVTLSVQTLTPAYAVALGLGTSMLDTTAYVATLGADGTGAVTSYWMSAKSAEGVVPTGEVLSGVSVSRSADGLLSFTFTRPLAGSGQPLSTQLTQPSASFVWALFNTWSSDPTTGSPADADEHFLRSRGVTTVVWATGAATAGGGGFPRAVMAHAVLMALAWGLLFPGGALASRLLKSRGGPRFFRAHMAANGVGFLFLCVAFGLIVNYVGADGGGHYQDLHAKLGLAVFVLFWAQPVNGLLRPKPTAKGAQPTRGRFLWELAHKNFGRALIALALLTCLLGVAETEGAGAAAALVKGCLALWVLWCVIGLGGGAVWLERRKRRAESGGEGGPSFVRLQEADAGGAELAGAAPAEAP